MENLELFESFGSESDYQDRIDMLQMAQEKLGECVDLIRDALKGTSHEGHARAYIIGHLEGWMDSPDRFNMGIQQYIDRLEQEEFEEYEEDED